MDSHNNDRMFRNLPLRPVTRATSLPDKSIPSSADSKPPTTQSATERGRPLRRDDYLPPPRTLFTRRERRRSPSRDRRGGWRDTDPPRRWRGDSCTWVQERLDGEDEEHNAEATNSSGMNSTDATQESTSQVHENDITDHTSADNIPNIFVTAPDGSEWGLDDPTEYGTLPRSEYSSWDEAVIDLRWRCPGYDAEDRRKPKGTCNCMKHRWQDHQDSEWKKEWGVYNRHEDGSWKEDEDKRRDKKPGGSRTKDGTEG